jgi:hypothetical protein
MSTFVYLSKIRRDCVPLSRVKLDESVIQEYAEAMEHKAQFPPITVFYDEIDYWCVDGFHRIAAALKKGETRISAIIKDGSLLQAQLYSFGVNKTHGLRRTNEDKRKAVEGALEHDKGSGRTDSVIAEHCGVTHELVRTVRASLESGGRICQVNERIGKDGKTYDVSKTQEANKKRAKKTTTSTTTTTVTVKDDLPEEAFVEEHEESKTAYVLEEEKEPTPEVVKDKLGVVVPERYAPAFQEVPPIINGIRQHLIQAQQAWVLASFPLACFLLIQVPQLILNPPPFSALPTRQHVPRNYLMHPDPVLCATSRLAEELRLPRSLTYLLLLVGLDVIHRLTIRIRTQ